MSTRKQKQRRGAKRSRKTVRGIPRIERAPTYKGYFPRGIPPFVRRQLVYINSGTATSGGAAAVIRHNPNSIWRPVSGGGTGDMPGYTALQAQYGYYRVVGYSYKVTIVNNEDFPIICYLLNMNADPGTTTGAFIASVRLSVTNTLSAKGGADRWIYSSPKHSICDVVGQDTPLFDNIYGALMNASPADVTWLGVGGEAYGAGPLAAGFSYRVELAMDTYLYDSLPTPTLLSSVASKYHGQEVGRYRH